MSAALDPARWHTVQQFLFHESRLLDERRFGEWLALLAPDAEYWVPQAWGQTDPHGHVSLFYETPELLRMRVDRLERELSPLDWPQARHSRQLSNVTAEAEDGTVLARANLNFVEYRRGEQRWFAGACRWRLLPRGDSFLIRSKRVDLLNCDQDQGHLRFSVPF